MVFLFIIITLILLFTIIIFSSKINIQIINLKFNSEKERHLNKEYKVIMKLYIFGKIPIIKTEITKQKLEDLKIEDKIKSLNLDNLGKKLKLDKNTRKYIKKFNIQIKEFNVKITIGTENSALTSIIVPTISTVVAILLRKKIKDIEKQKFIVQPVYQNQNLIYLDISGIFEIKIVNIINIIYRLTKKEKKEVKRYERTSDRRPYDYSYE